MSKYVFLLAMLVCTGSTSRLHLVPGGMALRNPSEGRFGAHVPGMALRNPSGGRFGGPVPGLQMHEPSDVRFPGGPLQIGRRPPLSVEESRWAPQIFEIAPLEDVVDELKTVVPDLFRKEPDWNAFSHDFRVIDRNGVELEGLESSKHLFKILQKMRKHIDRKDIQMHFIDGRNSVTPFGAILGAHLKVQVAGSDSKFFQFWKKKSSPIGIEADVVFHFDESNQVDYMRIDKWLINGRECSVGPGLNFFDDDSTNVKKIQQWAHDISELHKEFDEIDNLTGPQRADFFEEVRRVRASSEADLGLLLEDVNVIDFGSGYTRANLVSLSASGSATSTRVKNFRGIPLQQALTDPELMELLVDDIAEAFPTGRILAGATAGVRYALENGHITQDQVEQFEQVFSNRIGARGKFSVLTREQEAESEWASVEYALRTMEDLGAPGVPKSKDVNGMLSSGGLSCQLACVNDKGGAEFLSFDNLIGEGFFQYDDQKGPAGKDFAKVLPKFEASVRRNVKGTRIRRLKGVYVLTELWKVLSFKSPDDHGIMPYEVVRVGDVLSAIDLRLQELLTSEQPLTRNQAKVILVSILGRVVFREMFDPSAKVCFMGGDDMNWSIGWAASEQHSPFDISVF